MMNKYQMVFFLGLIIHSLALTGPIDTCPNFEAQSVIINQIPVGADFSSALTISIPLISSQPNSVYQPAVGYMSISIPNTQSIIFIDVWAYSWSTTTITIGITGANSGISWQLLKIIYIIVPSLYGSHIFIYWPTGCMTGTCLFDLSLGPSATVSRVQAYPLALPSGSYRMYGFINSFNIKTTNITTNIIGLSLSLSTNATNYFLDFTNQSQDPVILQSYRATVVVFRIPTTIFGAMITPIFLSTTTTSINDTSISSATTFFGLNFYAFYNADFTFDLSISGNSAQINWPSNLLGLGTWALSFQVGRCCVSTPVMDETNTTCIDSCPQRYYSTYYPDIVTTGCHKCLYDCYTCNTSTTCTTCNTSSDFRQLNPITLRCDPILGYYETGVSVALPCIYPKCCGRTPISYNEEASCVSICPNGLAQNASKVCVACGTGFWAISGQCTNVIGCVTNIVRNGVVQCVFCKVVDHFFLQNSTCICTKGYNLDIISGKCMEVCGDGIHFSQKCDDNNTEDGDGCSSSCETQDYFVCDSNSSYIPSQCAYIGAVQLDFKYANKTQGKNQAVFSFSFSTKRVKLNAAKIISSFSLTCNPRVSSVTMSASSAEVLLYVDYEEDLEGKLATVTFDLNPKKVLTNISLSTTFIMTSDKLKLVYLRVYPIIINLTKVIEVIALVALSVFLFASFVSKIIAVELLHSILLVYFICIETSNYTESYLVFRNLRILALNFENAGNYYSQGSIFSYSFQNQLLSKKTLLYLLLATFAAIMIQKTIRECLRDKDGKLGAKCSKILKIVKYSFMSVLFSLSAGYGYLGLIPSFTYFSNSNQDSYNKVNQYQATLVVFFLAVCFNICYFRQFGIVLWKKENTHFAKLLHIRNYIVLYFFFWFVITTLLIINATHKIGFFYELNLAFYLFLVSWFILYRPYNSSLHNAGQTFNLATDLLFLFWCIGRKYTQALTNQYTEVYIALATVVFILTSIVLSVCRVILVIYDCWSPSPVQTAPHALLQGDIIKIKCQGVEAAFEIKNKYMIRSMLLNQQQIQIKGPEYPSHFVEWKKQKQRKFKQKYLIRNNEDEEGNIDNSNIQSKKREC